MTEVINTTKEEVKTIATYLNIALSHKTTYLELIEAGHLTDAANFLDSIFDTEEAKLAFITHNTPDNPLATEEG